MTGLDKRLGTIMDSKLAIDIFQMPVNRTFRDHQMVRNFVVRHARGNAAYQLFLAFTQILEQEMGRDIMRLVRWDRMSIIYWLPSKDPKQVPGIVGDKRGEQAWLLSLLRRKHFGEQCCYRFPLIDEKADISLSSRQEESLLKHVHTLE